MSRFTAINLAQMAPPDVIETLDYERIVTELRDDLVATFPAIAGVIDLQSEPARKLIEAFAYREMLLRARINDAARSVMLASAYGANLDHLAALFGTKRMEVEDESGAMVLESDDRLRRRVQLAPDAFSVAGPEGAYVYHALTVAPWARDVTAISPRPGCIRVTVLRSGDQPSPALSERESVRMALLKNDVRPLTDMVEVRGRDVQRITVEATLTLYEGPDGTMVRNKAITALSDWLEANRMLGRNLRRSAIFSRLHVEGVHSVDLASPAKDVVLERTEVYVVDALTIKLGGLRDG